MPEDFDDWARAGLQRLVGRTSAAGLLQARERRRLRRRALPRQGRPDPGLSRAARSVGRRSTGRWRRRRSHSGYGWCHDHNAPEGTGVSPYAINSRDGIRISTNDGYLEPARGRPNLTILGNAVVDSVLFDGQSRHGRARADDRRLDASSRPSEILLCAGRCTRRRVLLRSGIGPADDVRGLGLDLVRADPGRPEPDGPLLVWLGSTSSPRRRAASKDAATPTAASGTARAWPAPA